MSIREYLKQLNYEQLRTAKDLAEEMIKAKEAEEKVPLWVVRDDALNYAAFREEQYAQAVERLCIEIKKESQHLPGYPLRFELVKRRFRCGEVAEMLALAET